MKAFISVDLEGMPYVVIPGHLGLKGSLYNEARKICTQITLIVAEELNKNGFDEILIADSHGPMVNLFVDDLPEYVELIRGYPRPTSMVSGVEECDVALFLGYHSKFGTTRSSFDHTYNSESIRRLVMNGVELSEFLLNGYAAGDFKVPIILCAGDAQLLKDDVNKYTPWVEAVALKHSLSRISARSSSMIKIEKELRGAVNRAISKFKEGKINTLQLDPPVKVTLTFLASHFADAAELLPSIDRIDGLTIEYEARSVVEAYKIFELLVLAGSGLTNILQHRQ